MSNIFKIDCIIKLARDYAFGLELNLPVLNQDEVHSLKPVTHSPQPKKTTKAKTPQKAAQATNHISFNELERLILKNKSVKSNTENYSSGDEHLLNKNCSTPSKLPMTNVTANIKNWLAPHMFTDQLISNQSPISKCTMDSSMQVEVEDEDPGDLSDDEAEYSTRPEHDFQCPITPKQADPGHIITPAMLSSCSAGPKIKQEPEEAPPVSSVPIPNILNSLVKKKSMQNGNSAKTGLTKDQLKLALVNLLETDDEFLEKIHTSYLQVLSTKLR
ncbi:hypothetical protein Ciccas_006408 [Cichlidogyrus casuarinus]|uniref:mRNA-decapping enzyme C-terminal domain-containing protein n=1 Tax=Cichlidogyrus casuarinus TaxID=1844966 RepID=A0ABD2Q5U3_9PLAT